VNLLNGAGYPLYSAPLGSGDWEVVVRGFEPAESYWRSWVGVVGATAYVGAVWLSRRNSSGPSNATSCPSWRSPVIVFLAYVVGSMLLVAASALNPIGPRPYPVVRVSQRFAAMAGLTAIFPKLVRHRVGQQARGAAPISFSAGGSVLGWLWPVVFTTVIGRGHRDLEMRRGFAGALVALLASLTLPAGPQCADNGVNPHDAQPRATVRCDARVDGCAWMDRDRSRTEFESIRHHAHGRVRRRSWPRIGLTRYAPAELQTPYRHCAAFMPPRATCWWV
jgi:hypothetical protein